MAEPKLVRDKIPDVLIHQGLEPVTHVVHGHEKREALAKLQEEVAEFLEAHEQAERSKVIEEIADVLEVIAALCDHDELSEQEIEAERTRKRTEKGAFPRGIVLEDIGEA